MTANNPASGSFFPTCLLYSVLDTPANLAMSSRASVIKWYPTLMFRIGRNPESGDCSATRRSYLPDTLLLGLEDGVNWSLGFTDDAFCYGM